MEVVEMQVNIDLESGKQLYYIENTQSKNSHYKMRNGTCHEDFSWCTMELHKMFLFLPSSPGCSLSSIEHVWKKGAIVGTRAWLWPAPRNSHDLLKVLLTTPSTEDRNGSCAGALGKPPIAQAGTTDNQSRDHKKATPIVNRVCIMIHIFSFTLRPA